MTAGLVNPGISFKRMKILTLLKQIIPVIFTLILIWSSTVTFAQERSRNTVVLINAGISIPFAQLGDKTMSYMSGFAGPGGDLETDLLWYGKRLGLCASVGYTNLFFAENAYKSEYERILEHEGKTTVSAGNYQTLKTTAGFIAKSREVFRTEILVMIQAGYALNVHPEIEVNNTIWGMMNSVEKDYDWQSISVLGFKINHQMTDKYGMTLSYTANYSWPGFNEGNSFYRYYYQPMRFQNINVGLLINLGL